MPSTKAWGRSASWHLVEIITALARIRVNFNLPKSWLVTTLSATPLHLASAASSSSLWQLHPNAGHPRFPSRTEGKQCPHGGRLQPCLSSSCCKPCQEHHLPWQQLQQRWKGKEGWSRSHLSLHLYHCTDGGWSHHQGGR